MTTTDNAEVMLERFRAALVAAGYKHGRRDLAALAVSDLIADARLYCHVRSIGWEGVCARAKEQSEWDLGELALMDAQAVDLRDETRVWKDGR